MDGNSDWASFLSGKAFCNRLAFHDELSKLLAAQKSGDGLQYIEQLYSLSSKLRKPCLRLRILQQVLGLDTRFSRDTVHGVVCLAFDVLEEMSRGAGRGSPSRFSPSEATGGSAAGSGESPRTATTDTGTGTGTGMGTGPGPGPRPSNALSRTASGHHLLATEPLGSAGMPSPSDEALDLNGFDEATRLEAEALLGTSSEKRRPSDPVGEESRRCRVQYYYR